MTQQTVVFLSDCESGTGTGFVSSESDDTEGILLETATASLRTGISNLILLEQEHKQIIL